MGGEWRECAWGDIATLEYGKSLRGYREAKGPYRVYGTNGPIGWHDQPLCSHPGIIVGRKGAYRGIHYSRNPFFVIDTAFYLEPKQEMDLRWAYYSLLTYDINGMDSGSAIPSTSRESFYRLPIRVPPLPEQRAIAHILGALDDKIELNRRMNETLEAMARAIFKSWFVDFDPVVENAVRAGKPVPERFAKTAARFRAGVSVAQGAAQTGGLAPHIAELFPDGFEDSELGEIPRGWRNMSLFKTAEYVNGAAFRTEHFCAPGKGCPVIKIAELKNGVTSRTRYSQRDLNSNQRIDTGDLLYSWSGSPDTSLDVFIWTGGSGLLNQHIFKVITGSGAQKRFIYFLLKSLRPLLVETARNKQTTGLGHVTVADMKRIRVCIPPDPVLNSFDSLAGSLFERFFRNDLQTATLTQIRDTLLPKLISGELQVPDADPIVGRFL